MNFASLERRLLTLECRRSGEPTVYLSWGRTDADAQVALAQARNSGAVNDQDEAVALVWPDADPLPPSRWVILGPKHEDEISDRELEVLHEAYEAEAVRRERMAAAEKGADLSSFDDTDVRIRIMRRESRDLTAGLRWLAVQANPQPETHWSAPGPGLTRACTCPRCQTGETSPRVVYPAHQARFQAWLERYVPGEGLFT